ncbi:MAG: chromate transporter [Treponema sp.]|nr:chromate transporter [Treponema sp.]
MNLLILYAEFFKIGLFSVGGGLATLPFLYRLADTYEWLNPELIGNILAIAQSSPGAIGVNMSASVGFQCAGIPGVLVTAFGLVSPSIIIIIIIARMIQAFKENAVIKLVFSGLRPAAAGLLAAAGFGAISLSLYNGPASVWYAWLKWRECILFALIFFSIYKFKGHPIIYIAIAGVAGIVLGL